MYSFCLQSVHEIFNFVLSKANNYLCIFIANALLEILFYSNLKYKYNKYPPQNFSKCFLKSNQLCIFVKSSFVKFIKYSENELSN